MRLWSLSPGYLDAKGLLAAWREGLLALAVLEGRTRGYRNHPQLIRFRASSAPAECAVRYLEAVANEADRRGYRFDRERIAANRAAAVPPKPAERPPVPPRIPVAEGQIAYEAALLLHKLRERDNARADALEREMRTGIELNPAFAPVSGDAAEWERMRSDIAVRPIKLL